MVDRLQVMPRELASSSPCYCGLLIILAWDLDVTPAAGHRARLPAGAGPRLRQRPHLQESGRRGRAGRHQHAAAVRLVRYGELAARACAYVSEGLTGLSLSDSCSPEKLLLRDEIEQESATRTYLWHCKAQGREDVLIHSTTRVVLSNT